MFPKAPLPKEEKKAKNLSQKLKPKNGSLNSMLKNIEKTDKVENEKMDKDNSEFLLQIKSLNRQVESLNQ